MKNKKSQRIKKEQENKKKLKFNRKNKSFKIKKNFVWFLLILLLCIFAFYTTFKIRLNYRYPLHLDEWYHLSEITSMELGKGNLVPNTPLRLGFHGFLLFLSNFFELYEVYYLFASFWAVFTVLVIYFTFKILTKNNYIALLTALIYALVGTNINLLGKDLFVPLTFAIPFIYLIIFFIVYGIENNKVKFFLYGILVALFLLISHPISVSFMIIPMFIYFVIRRDFFLKKKYLLIIILTSIFLGFLFFVYSFNGFDRATRFLVRNLNFKRGWGVFEYNNSFFELYSPFVYLFMYIGLMFFLKSLFERKKTLHKRLKSLSQRNDIFLFIILFVMFFMIILFRVTGNSFFSPYQRNMYYLALMIPYFSALGVINSFKFINSIKDEFLKYVLFFVFVFCLISLIVMPYKVADNIQLNYKLTEEYIYEISNIEFKGEGKVIAPPRFLFTLYPIVQKKPLVFTEFYGKLETVQEFYKCCTCACYNIFLETHNVDTIFSDKPINCDWEIIRERPYVYYRDLKY